MVIETTKSFDKQYSKLNSKARTSFRRKLELFKVNSFDVRLRNHSLQGKYLGYRSIDVTGDIRALYTTKGNTIIIFGFIGLQSQLY